MKIGLVSDSHDHGTMVNKVLEIFKKIDVGAIVHAGDFVAPFTVKKFLGQQAPFYAVFGNNDGERKGISAMAPAIREGPTVFDIGGVRVGVVHIREDWNDQPCDLLVFGHTHVALCEKTAFGLIVNPGELCGWLMEKCTAAVYDTDTHEAEIIEV
ncbi:MAG: metallophosphoesterase [Planctomycetota bacterium]